MLSEPSYKHLFLVLRLALSYVDRDLRPFSIDRSSLFVFAGGGIRPLAHLLSVTTRDAKHLESALSGTP